MSEYLNPEFCPLDQTIKRCPYTNQCNIDKDECCPGFDVHNASGMSEICPCGRHRQDSVRPCQFENYNWDPEIFYRPKMTIPDTGQQIHYIDGTKLIQG